jgi:uncharacterized SAM-binding protein YcdF (DUF218 family)
MNPTNIHLILVLTAEGERGRKRLEGALKLYTKLEREGKRPIIIVTGCDAEEDESLKNAIEKYGGEYRILVERFSRYTDESKRFSEIIVRKLLERGYIPEKIIIVTDTIHAPRVRGTFGKEVCGSPTEYYTVEYRDSRALLHEIRAYFLRFLWHLPNKLTKRV